MDIPKKRKKRNKKQEENANPYYQQVSPSMYSTFKKKFSGKTTEETIHDR